MSKSSKAKSDSASGAEHKKHLAKPLTPDYEKLFATALDEVKKASAGRLKHKLPENSEPSMVFQIRPEATTKW